MRLLLIRHGETVDNVAGIFAGVRDSALTTHGVLQAGRLGGHLAARFPSSVRAVFTSDLQRAARTAAAGVACRSSRVHVDDVAETASSMRARARRFLDEMLLPLLRLRRSRAEDDVVVVVAHGLFLPKLYGCLLERVPWQSLTLDPELLMSYPGAPPPLQPWWSNTAYLECTVMPDATTGGRALRMHVLRVNCTTHLKYLTRTRGGIGSAPHDARQRTIDSYFGKRM
ncbi:proteinrelated to alpha-ribazole-5'-phosphate phosphatase [Beauveria brongniartii RCEF 3172]|uniref:Proteinrelated to alpha-ribazole-5'-phosphate phosphatase n=1 Tax=Beauveria brongniartii RCEF 3172 TaxID=1081107 RepID=A0A166XAW8_9HYPO|nr:proteinrelated to alpha-ribazole-5'-phosphate phosphatase [Beauveria brongniartii RCEF 3172]